MTFALAGVALLLALLGLARLLVAVPAATLARVVPQWLGWGLFLGGNLLMFTGRAIIGGPMLMAGLGLLRYAGQRMPVGSIPTPGQTSTVRSRGLAMELDHATGALSGTVLTGIYSGQQLDALDDTACLALWQSFTDDGESRALLEAYLDRRSPGWREHVQADHDTGQGRATSAGVMSLDEAYEILGLRPNATETEVREAHRRLMMAVHPDRGGSTFLAARVNEAKDLLIARHKSSSRS